MLRFICGRLVQSVVLLVLVSMIGFAVLHLAPGGPLRNSLSRRAFRRPTSTGSPHRWAWTDRLPIQYWDWSQQTAARATGVHSYRDRQPVLTIIGYASSRYACS